MGMHGTTILLDPEIKAKAEDRAKRLGISPSQLIRQSLEKKVVLDPRFVMGGFDLFA